MGKDPPFMCGKVANYSDPSLGVLMTFQAFVCFFLAKGQCTEAVVFKANAYKCCQHIRYLLDLKLSFLQINIFQKSRI